MNTLIKKPHSQRGVALLMAILIVALATILAVSIASDGYMDQRRTGISLGLDQAYEVGLGAEALAADTLQNDDAKQDTTAEAWSTPVTLPFNDESGEQIGTIQGNLEDLQGRFNLNNVLNPDGTRNDAGVRQFKRLLELLDIDTKWATLLVDWLDANNEPEFPDGAEDTVYAGQTPSYLTANMPITRTSELMYLKDFSIDDYRKLEPYIAALPIDSKLNVCTAPPIVLDSLSGALTEYSNNVETLNANRADGCFPTVAGVKNSFSQDTEFQQLLQSNADYLAENSNYFRANLWITIGTTDLALYSVLNRTGTGNNVRVRIIQRSFGST